jgi:predicted transcriptional regulator
MARGRPREKILGVTGARIEDLRLEHGDLVMDLADLIGVHRMNFYRRMDGAVQWRIDELRKLADHFGVSLDHLVGRRS